MMAETQCRLKVWYWVQGSGCDMASEMRTYACWGKFDWGNFHLWLSSLEGGKGQGCYWLWDYYGNHTGEPSLSEGMKWVGVRVCVGGDFSISVFHFHIKMKYLVKS